MQIEVFDIFHIEFNFCNVIIHCKRKILFFIKSNQNTVMILNKQQSRIKLY